MSARRKRGVGNQRPRQKPMLKTMSTGDSHEMFTKRPKRLGLKVIGEGLDHESLGTGLNVGGPKNPQQRVLGDLSA